MTVPLRTHQDEQLNLNLTPMVDVVFQLIIFFVVATKFNSFEQTIRLEVPKVSQHGAATPTAGKQVVNVYQDGRIALESQLVTMEELVDQLRRARSHDQDLGILIRGDAGVAYQRVAEVLAACRRAGIARLGISVRTAHAPSPESTVH
jgi:biopolymer transport protein ExbD